MDLRRINASLFVFTMTAGSCPTAESRAEGPIETQRSVTIRIYDYSGVSAAIHARARQEATRVLAAAGIAAFWHNCPLTMDSLVKNAACDGPFGANDIALRVHPKGTHPYTKTPGEMFGYALIDPSSSEPARIAGVLYENVETMAWKRLNFAEYDIIHRSIPHGKYTGIILGHVVAHEIGHLLLGSNRHAKRGIMQAHWTRSTVAEAIKRRLNFSEEQARRINKTLGMRASRYYRAKTPQHW